MFKEDSAFSQLIYPFLFKLDGELPSNENHNLEATKINLIITNRSIYGLNIDQLSFYIKYKIINVKD
jgi:hypothetical protein